MEATIDIRKLRSDMNLSQAQLGEMLGVDQSTISNWETSRKAPRGPAVKLLESIAQSLHSKAAQ